MTWQAAAFTILAVGLAAGFAWYERTKPDARLVALVGTLAAFAALGRIAFAAIPNVKPTTDIVLIAGFALGGAPGFVVGAVAGLTSNFFFGQGPWTPWQMAAWGMTGVIGAGVAVLTGRRIGRWPLALVCGVAGFAFTAVQDLGDWVTYSDHSRAQLGVYVAKGIGFDAVHALGCVAFALAFGPALIRSIQRFARRLQVTWLPAGGGTLSVVAALVCAGLMAAGLAAAPPARAATPESYLAAAQNSDGGLGAAQGASSSELFSGWAALAFAAEGHNPQVVRNGGQSLTGYIASQLSTAPDVGSVERTILVVRAAGLSATAFGGRDLVATLLAHVRRNGSVGGLVNLTSFAILALRAAGHPVAPATRSWLLRQQDSDGGFNFATRGRHERRRRHRRRARGARGLPARRPPGPCTARSRFIRSPAEPRRRVPVPAGRRFERPVDGLGGPGPDRGRRQPGLAASPGCAVAACVPAIADRPRRARAVLARQRPDAGVGDRAGADGARRKGAAAGSGRAPGRPEFVAARAHSGGGGSTAAASASSGVQASAGASARSRQDRPPGRPPPVGWHRPGGGSPPAR